LHAIEIDLRVMLRRIVDRQLIDRKSQLAQDRQRRPDVPIITAKHPQHARLHVQRRIELLPQLERALDHLDVHAIRPVHRTDHPRLAPRARPRIARPPRVDKRDVRAELEEMKRRPAAEGAGADDFDAGLGGWRDRRNVTRVLKGIVRG